MKSDQTVQCDVLTQCAHLYMLHEWVFCSPPVGCRGGYLPATEIGPKLRKHHELSDREECQEFQAKEMLQKARQPKHEGYKSILERCHKDDKYRNSLFIGWTEEERLPRKTLHTSQQNLKENKKQNIGSQVESRRC